MAEEKKAPRKTVKKAAAKKAAAEGADRAKSAGRSLETARERFSEVAEGVSRKVKSIGGGAGRAGQKVRAGAEKAGAVAREKAEVVATKARHGYERARKDLDHLTDDLNEYVRDNPAKAVLIAAGIGFFLGILLRGRGRD